MAELTPLMAMRDFSTSHTGNQFNTKYANRDVVDGRKLNPWSEQKYKSRNNTQIAGALEFILPTLQREMVQIDPLSDPLTTRVAPFVRIDQLNIVKNARRLVRGDIPIVPHRGALTIAETEQITRHRRQVRRGKEVEIELTSLFTDKGLVDLEYIMKGLSQSLLDSHQSAIMLELATASGQEAALAEARSHNPMMDQSLSHGDAQKNALLEYIQVRTETFFCLAKPGPLRFDLLIQKAREHIQNAQGVPDTLVCGPGIKVRISLQDPTMVFHYAVGPGKQWLRNEGADAVKSFQGLGIIEANTLNPNSSARSRATRRVEVGESNRIGQNGGCAISTNFHPRQRNIEIYDQGRDRMHELCLEDAVNNSVSFSTSTGNLVPELQQLADEFNTGNTQYMRDNGLSADKIKRASKYSPFLFQDDNGNAHVAKYFGQMEQDDEDKRDQNIGAMARASLEALIPDSAVRASICNGLNVGVGLLTRGSEETVDEKHWEAVLGAAGQTANLVRFHLNELKQRTDAKGNQFGSLDYGPTGGSRIPRIQGFGNGAGMRELASKYMSGSVATGDGSIFAEAYIFMNAVNKLVSILRPALPTAETVNPDTSSAKWFHGATAATTFVDSIYAGLELPVWVGGGEADSKDIVTVDLRSVIPLREGAAPEELVAFLVSVEKALQAEDDSGDNVERAIIIADSLSGLAIGQDDEASTNERALGLLQQVLARSDIVSAATKFGLGQIDIRLGLAQLALRRTEFPGIERRELDFALSAVVAYMVGVEDNDISPVAFRAVENQKASLKLIREVVAYFYSEKGDRATMELLLELSKNLGGVSAWWAKNKKKIQRKVKNGRILNDIPVASTFTAMTNDLVRTPLTVSHRVLQGLVVAGLSVSDPHSPWKTLSVENLAGVRQTPFGVSGAAAIGTSLHSSTFAHNKLKPGARESGGGGGDGVSKRARGFGGGGGGQSFSSKERSRSAPRANETSLEIENFLGVTNDMYDFGGSSGESARFGTQWPSMSGADAMDEEGEALTDEALGRTLYYQRNLSKSFRLNYEAAKKLNAAERAIAVTILFTPINRVNAATLARRMYLPLDALFMRPHITHQAMSAWALQAGPETFINAYTETDARWGIDTEAKILKFALTYSSAAFLHNPQFTFPLLDICPARNAYQGGNGTEFFKRGSAEYNLRTQSTTKSLYAALIPMAAIVAEPLDLTGVYHMSQYDNNDPAALTPHYPGAPFLSKMWDWQRLVVKRGRDTGFDDQLRNSLLLPGRQHNVGPLGGFTIIHKNQGHLGPTFPGVKQFRNGSSLVPRPTSTTQMLC